MQTQEMEILGFDTQYTMALMHQEVEKAYQRGNLSFATKVVCQSLLAQQAHQFRLQGIDIIQFPTEEAANG